MKKKILFLIPELSIGGGEKTAVMNANDMSSAGYDVTLLVPRGHLIKQNVSPSVNLVAGRCSGLFQEMIFCWHSISIINPDVVISYMERANFINLVLSRLGHWKVIASIHTVPSVAYKNRGLVNRLFIRLSMLLIKKYNSVVFCVSAGVGKELRDLYGIHNTYIIENYFPVPEYSDLSPEVENSNVLFCFVGRLVKIKGCELLLKAISLSKEKGFLDGKLFWIVGDGPERKNLEETSQALGIDEYVSFLGARDDVSHLLNAADCLIVPSYVEGFGLVIIEALYSGCDIFFSKCKYGPSEIMSNFKNSHDIYDFEDPSFNEDIAILELSNHIDTYNNKKNRSKLKILRDIISQKYSKELSIDKIIDLVEMEK